MKARTLTTLSLLALALTATAQQTAKTPAFPGAEGYGRYTTGGRGGNVYCVTNLNDSGQGSLRWALSQPGPRTVVFNVDGTIHLKSSLYIPSNTTVAGQTAPGMGICVADFPFALKGSNIIVRYMRIRLGNTNVALDEADGWDGFGGYDSRDIIIDHCSVSWSIDECLSVYGNINSTVQWCIAAQSLVNSGHSKGAHGYGAIWGGSGASFHHNLLLHHSSREPRLGGRPTTQLDERVDMRNNVFYNWGGEGSYGYEAQNVNIVNNYFKPGPGTEASMNENKQRRIAAVGIRSNKYIEQYPDYADAWHIWGKYYVNGNENASFGDVKNNNWELGVYNQVDASGCDGTWTQATKDSIRLSDPIAFVHTTTHSAKDAYDYVTQYAGACKGGQYDALDQQYIQDTKFKMAKATGTGLNQGFINTQDDNKAIVNTYGTAWPPLTEGEKWTDTDGDGMPDEWETAHGLNPNDAADGNTLNAEGYTNLEVYMNALVADITEKCTELTKAAVQGQEEVPESMYDNYTPEAKTAYSIVNADQNVGPGKSITEVAGITLTFSNTATDWIVKGSGSDKCEVDGVQLTGKYAQSEATNGVPVILNTTQAGTLTIFLGGDIATNKKVFMTEGDNGLNGKLLSNGAEVVCGEAPAKTISAWDGIVYTLEADKSYEFKATGTKWRLAGFRYITDSSGIQDIKRADSWADGPVYDLSGRRVANRLNPTLPKGIYTVGGKKIIVK